MSLDDLHLWALDPDEATILQENLHQRLILTWDDREVNFIGGVDVCYKGDSVLAAIALASYPDLSPLDVVVAQTPLRFPYIPGLLAFRIGPAILAAWEKLTKEPDLLMVNGHGSAHPRRMGLASHIGLWINTPTIGVANTRLYGCQSDSDLNVGQWTELLDEGDPKRIIGAVLRTRIKSKPIYVSPGNLIDLAHSMMFVLACCQGYRMPEPIRTAHIVAGNAQTYLKNQRRIV